MGKPRLTVNNAGYATSNHIPVFKSVEALSENQKEVSILHEEIVDELAAESSPLIEEDADGESPRP